MPLDINGQPVVQRRLRDADELLLGGTRLLFEEPAEEPIDSLMAEPDRPLPPPSAPPAELPADSSPGQAAPERDSRASRSRPPPPPFDADLIIYALAAIVIAVSVAGLIALISAR
jgi:hypothetical protein